MALGASATAGIGLEDGDSLYVEQIHDRMQVQWEDLILDNRAVSGRRMTQMIDDLKDLTEADVVFMTIFPSTDYAYTAPAQFEKHAKSLLNALDDFEVTVLWGDRRINPELVCGGAKDLAAVTAKILPTNS